MEPLEDDFQLSNPVPPIYYTQIPPTEITSTDTPNDNLRQASYLANRCGNLAARYQQTKQLDHLEKAAEMAKQSLDIIVTVFPDSSSSIDRPRVLIGRAVEWSPNIGILMEAARILVFSTETSGERFSHLGSLLSVISDRLELRFGQTGRIEDIQDAVGCLEMALQMHSDDPWQRQIHLASLLDTRSSLTGNVEDLNASIEMTELVLATIPKNHGDLVITILNLGDRFERRFIQSQHTHDLDEAIRRTNDARDATIPGDESVGIILCSISGKMEKRYTQTGSHDDLHKSIEFAKEATAVTPRDNPNYWRTLRALGSRLQTLYEISNSLEELDSAIQVTYESAMGSSVQQMDRPELLKEYSTRLLIRFNEISDLNDLRKATSKVKEALNIIPEDHPDRSNFLHLLGTCYHLLPEACNSNASLDCFLETIACQSSQPSIRLLAAIDAFHILRQSQDWTRASDVSKQGIDLVPFLDSHNTQDAIEQKVTTYLSDFIADACSVQLENGSTPETTLELLELGYGSITALQAKDTADLAELRVWYPEITSTFIALRREINQQIPHSRLPHIQQGLIRRRLAVSQELDDCISTIRQLPSHDRFLLGLTAGELQHFAGESVIIIVNITEIRSDAIIVSKSGVSNVPLRKVDVDIVQKRSQHGLFCDEQTTVPLDQTSLSGSFLRWLSRTCIKPILEAMGLLSTTASPRLPELHWIGVGLARDLPFQAATEIYAARYP
ncbi:hypothetical protein ASPWEDRAFT_170441 [Aspergillus wentii DTO 134E9]|uniref:CHAT domain-containing protein n=1 Tax=Aspergillus wentii DTO 134E9 TaxID=1073089 RepID=A0A1L9RQ43_ASPWE|nr:uncharacterized protein ASPWEDRAFT_170441 [Aspergillus wentii DTO 134E9]KAI9923924.1 hypothetical protein MW887_008229 [Aspergillus wentii]OJJ36938.1 hypothetical protein ASPWEDRAFT_170441 [Aspergillus wentii DTO 134E9]